MAIKIYSEVYPVFYFVLLEHFGKKELDEKKLKELGIDSYLIWEQIDPKTKTTFFRKVFEPHATHHRFWYKKLSEYDREGVSSLSEKSGTMAFAFKYLGYSLPIGVNTKSRDLEAKILHQLFLEEHMPDFFADNSEELKVYDHETKSLIKVDSGRSTIEKRISSEDALLINEVSDVITNYFELINEKRFEEAFDFFNSGIKKEFSFDLTYFKNLFHHTISISKIQILPFDLQYLTSFSVDVLYLEEKYIFTKPEYDNLSWIPLGYIDELTNKAKGLTKDMKKSGFNFHHDLIAFKHLLEENFSEYLIAILGIHPKDIEGFLPLRKVGYLRRFCQFRIELKEDEWVINDISSNEISPFVPFHYHTPYEIKKYHEPESKSILTDISRLWRRVKYSFFNSNKFGN